MKRPAYFSARMERYSAGIITYRIPETLRGYRLVSAYCELTTDATVANRQLALSVLDRDTNVKTVASEATFQTASEINAHSWGGTGSPYESAGAVSFSLGGVANFAVHTPLQQILVEGGDLISIELQAGAAGDAVTSGILWFEAVPWLDEA